jgi:molybdopterin-guanine dinucleotide biosynthesis protein A
VTAGGQVPRFDAIILAGGKAARMGSADKPGLDVGGTPMIVSVAAAAAATGAQRLVIVGPVRPGRVQEGLEAAAGGLSGGPAYVREDPPGSGPVPALRRGLAEVGAPWVLVLAADLPFLTASFLAGLLVQGAAAGARGVVPADEHGELQWLAGCWQTAALRGGLASHGGGSLGGLLGPLRPVTARAPALPLMPPGCGAGHAVLAAPWRDCDTPEDLAAARRLAGQSLTGES